VFLSTRVVVMSARPGRVSTVVPIDLPRHRSVETREMERYFQLVTEVREALRRPERDHGAESAESGPAADELARARAEGLSG
jgi:NitT/TauT family transport system ATP-binding protein